MTNSYLLYVGPEDLYVEMGLCTSIAREGETITVDDIRYVVSSVRWDVYTKGSDPRVVPPGYYPQQCATVTLKRV